MPLVLGTKIATLGGGWRRITNVSEIKTGEIYCIPRLRESGFFTSGAIDSDDPRQYKVYAMAAPEA